MKVLVKFAVMITIAWGALVAADEVPDDAWSVRPSLPGTKASAFVTIDAFGRQFEFKPHALERPTVLIFYRGGWCPFCNLHWAELRKAEDDLLALGVDLIFLSADSPEVLAEAVADEDDQPRYRLLSDGSMAIARAYGIAYRVDDATYDRYAARGIVDLEKASGYDHHYLPVPAVFIIGVDGIIRFQYANPDYKVRLHPDVLIAAARTMPQYKLEMR